MNNLCTNNLETLSNTICNNLESMIKSYLKVNLENCTGDAQNALSEEGEQTMAHKFQQRVKVIDGGEEVYKWATGETQEDFQKSLYDILVRYGKYSTRSVTLTNNRIWSEYAWEWFNVYKRPTLKQKTITSRECFTKKHVVPAFGDRPISSISRKDVQEYLNSHSNMSKSYMRDIMNYMNGVFKAAVDDDIIMKNPMDSDLIKNPCKREAHRSALTEDEKADIIAHIPDLKQDVDKALMALLMYTIMRPGEIYALQWRDIDFENNIIHVLRGGSFDNGKLIVGEDGDTKTGWKGVRDLPLHEPLKPYLLAIKKDDGFVLTRHSGKFKGEPFSEQAYKCQVARIRKQIDIHGMTLYVARHSYISEAIHNGISIDTVAAMAGHTDRRMIMKHYLHTNDKQLQIAGHAMEGYFKKLTM